MSEAITKLKSITIQELPDGTEFYLSDGARQLGPFPRQAIESQIKLWVPTKEIFVWFQGCETWLALIRNTSSHPTPPPLPVKSTVTSPPPPNVTSVLVPNQFADSAQVSQSTNTNSNVFELIIQSAGPVWVAISTSTSLFIFASFAFFDTTFLPFWAPATCTVITLNLLKARYKIEQVNGLFIYLISPVMVLIGNVIGQPNIWGTEIFDTPFITASIGFLLCLLILRLRSAVKFSGLTPVLIVGALNIGFVCWAAMSGVTKALGNLPSSAFMLISMTVQNVIPTALVIFASTLKMEKSEKPKAS